jgi:hypothetical protein
MKCKNCKSMWKIETAGDGFICAGINKKPSVHPLDKIRLCIKAEKCYREMELTQREAGYICSALSMCSAMLSKPILTRIK